MKIKVSRIVPKGYSAITLWPFGIYVSDEKYLDDNITDEDRRLMNHEKIHWQQQCEMLGLFFYLWYGVEWFIKYITPPVGAYIDLGFEREANKHEGVDDYLKYFQDVNGKWVKKRKKFAWFKHVFKV